MPVRPLDARAPHPAQARAPGRPAAPAHHQAFTAGHAADAGSQRTLAGDGRAARVHAAPLPDIDVPGAGWALEACDPNGTYDPFVAAADEARGAVRGLTDRASVEPCPNAYFLSHV